MTTLIDSSVNEQQILPITPPLGSTFSLNETVDLDENAKEYLHTVRELFKQDGCMDYSDKELLNWLTTNQNHRGKALAALSESLIFRTSHINPLYKSLPPPPLTLNGSVFEQSKFCRVIGKAKDNTPLLLCELQALSNHVIDRENEKNMTLMQAIYKDLDGKDQLFKYIFNVLEDLRKEGVFTEKITVIIDRGTTKEPSLTIARYLIPLFQKHFPNRLSKLAVFPVSGASSWMLWSAIKVLIDKSTVPKVTVSEKSCLNDYLQSSSSSTDRIEISSTTASTKQPMVQTQSSQMLLLERLEDEDAAGSSNSAANISTDGSPVVQSGTTPTVKASGGGFWSKFRQTSKETPTSATRNIEGVVESSKMALVEEVEVLWEAPEGALPLPIQQQA